MQAGTLCATSASQRPRQMYFSFCLPFIIGISHQLNVTSAMSKPDSHRKELLRQFKAKEKEDFLKSLPADKSLFLALFNYLDEKLTAGCDHQLTMTKEFLHDRGVKNIDEVVSWLN